MSKSTGATAFRSRITLWTFCLSALLLLIVGGTMQAATTEPKPSLNFERYKIVVHPELSDVSQFIHGYVRHRLTATNNSNESHEVQFIIRDRDRDSDTHLTELTRTVRIDAGKTVTVSMYHPVHPQMRFPYLHVKIDGSEPENPEPLRLRSGSRSGVGSGQFVVSKRFNQKMDNWDPSRIGGISSVTDSRKWATNWLGYSCLDGVYLTAEDLKDMSPAQQQAIWQFTEAGGTLVVLGDFPLPATWLMLQGGIRDQRFDRFGNPLSELSTEQYGAGFGTCFITRKLPAEKIQHQIPSADRVNQELRASMGPFGSGRNQSIQEANRTFPVVDDLSIPVRGLFVIMLGFVIIIGPVNISLLGKMKKKIWLLWTVPVISFITVLLVFGFIIAYEGWDGHQRTQTLTYLDQPNQRATTLGWTGYYTPLVPSSGLQFSTQTELTLQDGYRDYDGHFHSNYSRYQAGNKQCAMDWSGGQSLQGWLTARVPVHFRVRKSESSRLKLNVTREGNDNLRVVNLLGAPIKRLWIVDADQNLCTAKSIGPGAQGIARFAKKATLPDTSFGLPLRRVYYESWLLGMKKLRNDPESYLQKGTYLAELEGTPFLEDGLEDAQQKKSSLVYGVIGEIK